MIGNAIKGAGFRGVLDYCGRKPGARLLGGNLLGHTPRALAREFGEVRRLRPGLSKPVLHLPVRSAPGETLTDEQWRTIAARLPGVNYFCAAATIRPVHPPLSSISSSWPVGCGKRAAFSKGCGRVPGGRAGAAAFHTPADRRPG